MKWHPPRRYRGLDLNPLLGDRRAIGIQRLANQLVQAGFRELHPQAPLGELGEIEQVVHHRVELVGGLLRQTQVAALLVIDRPAQHVEDQIQGPRDRS